MGRMQNPVHLVLGEDEFLASRTTKQLIAEAGPEAEVTTLRASEITPGEIVQATSPSLFAEDRVLVIEKTELVGKEPLEALLQACVDVPLGVTIIVQHTGGGRLKAYTDKLAKIAQVHDVKPLGERERHSWLTSEFKRHGVRPTPDVVAALLESVGSNLRELSSAVSQLIADTEGEITVAAVREYYIGVAEVAGFDIADQAISGRADRAVASARRALQLGVEPAAIAAALAYKVGDIAKLYGVRGNPKDISRELGMPFYGVKRSMQVARQWSGDAISEAVIIVAELDAAAKGQGGEADFEVEDAVRRIAELAS